LLFCYDDRQNHQTIEEIKTDRLIYPVSRDQALKLLKSFVTHFLPAFGTYEDAMVVNNWQMFHSRLSFALNTAMLHPRKVIEEPSQHGKKRLVTLKSTWLKVLFVKSLGGGNTYAAFIGH
jgi:deoxyribodipyrimidine photolyase-like uncharacterized protein